jgi:hypothetical protein
MLLMEWFTRRWYPGSSNLLRADQLDADPVQGCGYGATKRGIDRRAVPARRRRGEPVRLADGSVQPQREAHTP